MIRNLVSIIVPVHNVQDTLNRCMFSIIYQTYKNIEIILVDDESTDECPQICDRWKDRDPRIIVLHKKNGGLSVARNAGLKIAKGEYIYFVDPNDTIALAGIEKMVQTIQKYDADLVICQFVYVATNGNCEKSATQSEEELVLNCEQAMKLLLEDKTITNHVWRKLYKASVWNGLEFPCNKNFEDMFVMYKVFSRCKKIISLNKAFYFHYDNPKGMVHKNSIKSLNDLYDANNERQYGINSLFPNLKNELNASLVPYYYKIWDAMVNMNDDVEVANLRRKVRNSFKEMKKNNEVRMTLKLWMIIYTPSVYSLLKRSKTFHRVTSRIRYYSSQIKSNQLYYSKLEKSITGRFFILFTPNHGNLGDQAILMAEIDFLKKFFPQHEIVLIPMQYLDRTGIFLLKKKITKDDCIFIHGGGNIGTLYPYIHKIQEQAISSFRKNRVFIFPQSFFYSQDYLGNKMLKKSVNTYKKMTG